MGLFLICELQIIVEIFVFCLCLSYLCYVNQLKANKMKIKLDNISAANNQIKVLGYLSGGLEEWETIQLFKKLRRLEAKIDRLNTAECNGEIDSNVERDNKLFKQVRQLLPVSTSVFINGDPRGYAIKLQSDEVHALRQRGFNIYTDFGGYGIIAPEL